MQPNADRKFTPPETQNSGQNINLSLSELMPGIFDEMPPLPGVSSQVQPPFVPNPVPPQHQARPAVQDWVANNFKQPVLAEPAPIGISQTASNVSRDPLMDRLRRRIPLLGHPKAGPWLIMVAIFLAIISIGVLLGWLYYNNILGTVSPSNGPLEAYPGATRLDVNQKASNYIYEVEKDLPELPGAISVPSVTSDNTAQVTAFYNHLMSGKGYAAVSGQSMGLKISPTTLLGPSSLLYYTKSKKIARVEMVTLTTDINDLHLKKGDTLLILATNQA